MKPESDLENMVKRNKTVLTYRHDFMVHHYGVTPGSWWMCGLTWQKMSRLWWARLSHSLITSQLHRNHLSCDLWLKLAEFLNSLRKKHVFTKELQVLHLKKKAKAVLFLANKECWWISVRSCYSLSLLMRGHPIVLHSSFFFRVEFTHLICEENEQQ